MSISGKIIASIFFIVVFISSFGATCAKSQYYQSLASSEYQIQFEAIYSKIEWDDGDDQRDYGAEFLINFMPVNVGGHPLYEAAFLERVGHISLDVGHAHIKLSSSTELDGPFYGIYVDYMSPDNPLVWKANIFNADYEYNLPIDAKWSKDVIGAGLGLFLKDGLLITFEYSRKETDLSISGLPNDESRTNLYTVSGKSVTEFGNDKAVNIEVGIDIEEFEEEFVSETNTIINVEGDYYLNSRTSLGGLIAKNTGDDKSDENTTFGIRLISFLTPDFYFRVDFERAFFNDNYSYNDSKRIFMNAGMRF
ncbi:MAG: hypothetical protein ACMUIM_01805 [bacterium]